MSSATCQESRIITDSTRAIGAAASVSLLGPLKTVLTRFSAEIAKDCVLDSR